MTSPSFESWEPEVPPEGFADRVTAAVLRDRPLAIASAARRPRRRAWVMLVAAACVAAAGMAWAWTSHPRQTDPTGSRLAPVERADPTPSSVPHLFPSETTPVAPKPAFRPSAIPSAAASASAPRPKVPAPICICNAYGCDCGPE